MSPALLSPVVAGLMAKCFKALSEPARLQILYALSERERTVSELVADTALSQANVSKHLQVLFTVGCVKRRKNGLYVHYSLANDCFLALCEQVHDNVYNQSE
jgi:DNA-binding transcriptional ArsR family regulator